MRCLLLRDILFTILLQAHGRMIIEHDECNVVFKLDEFSCEHDDGIFMRQCGEW